MLMCESIFVDMHKVIHIIVQNIYVKFKLKLKLKLIHKRSR